MANNLQVQDLDFESIKQNFIDYMKSQEQFKDYDYKGSSMNILLDLLAYNTHYMGFYTHMLANESFIDSATQKASLTSKAKLMNYIPSSKQSAEALVTFNIPITAVNEPTDKKIVLPRGTNIRSNNNANDSRNFVIVDDVYIYNRATTAGVYDYTSDEIGIFEGAFNTQRFLVDDTLTNQRFIIRDRNVDITSLRISVYDTQASSEFVSYTLAEDFNEINSESNVFFVAVNEENYYEVFFGNDIYGKSLANLNVVSASFVSTSGEEGNNARTFILSGGINYLGTDYDVDITTVNDSHGGVDEETLEDLRFNIPYHYRRQNRLVTVDDYKNILLSKYRNINSINIWGGEDNIPKTYGKVFISIKPRFGEVLSSKAKNSIINDILKKYNVTTVEPEIVDPEFLYVNLDVNVRFNPLNTNKSSGEIGTEVTAIINDYNDNTLNRFGSFYSDVNINSLIKSVNPSILTSYADATLEKRIDVNLNTKATYFADFVNEILPETVKSDEFMYRLKRCYFADNKQGNIIIYYYDTFKKEWVAFPNETFGTVDYENGIIRLVNFEVNDLYGQSKLNINATPKLPDFFTKRNNVVMINQFTVKVVADFQNEGNKAW